MGSPGCCRHGIEDELMSFLTFDSYYSHPEDDGHLALATSAASGQAFRGTAPPPHLSRPLKPLMPATRTRPIPRMTSEGLGGMGKVAKPIRQASSPPSRPPVQDPHQRLVPASGGGGRRRAVATATATSLSPTHRSDHPVSSSAPRVLSLAKERLRQSIKERLAAKLQREQMGNPPLPLGMMAIGLPPRHSISSEQERFILELAQRDSELQRMADARRRRRSSEGGRSPVGSEGKVWELDVKAWTGGRGNDGAEASAEGQPADPRLLVAMRGSEEHSMAHLDEMLAGWTSTDSHQETVPRWEESSPSAASMGSHQSGPLQEEWAGPCLGEFLLPHAPPEGRELSEREFTHLFLNPTMAGGNHVATPSMMMVGVPPPTAVAPTAYFDPTEAHHPEYPKASFWGY